MATTVKLDDELNYRVQRLAVQRGRSAHSVMQEAITQYVEREEKREAFKDDAKRAWDEYQASGLHLTFEAADTWLARLETGEKIEQSQ